MTDGSQLRKTWYNALNDAEAYFKHLLTSPSSDWKRMSSSSKDASSSSSSKGKGKARVSSVPELADVLVHRAYSKAGEEVYRIVLDVPTPSEDMVSLEPWKTVLTTPELRTEWDPAVEDAHLLEVFDHTTRICKTNFTLGWPANPRDAVTISRSFHDPTTVIDISTSLPRSADEPAYLRPSPPFVRSHVKLFAWCIQHIPSPPPQDDQVKKPPSRIRITCFWQHDLKAMWGFGSTSAGVQQQLSTMVLSMFKSVIKRGERVPKLGGYGHGVSIGRVRYQVDREALTVDYSILPDDEDHLGVTAEQMHGVDEVQLIREQRRLTRSVECILPSLEGWDVLVSVKASSEEVEQLPWSAHAIRGSSNPSPLNTSPPDQIILRITHSPPPNDHSVLRIKLVIEVSGASRGLRLNGLPKTIYDSEPRDPQSYGVPQAMLADIASAVDLSVQTSASSLRTTGTSVVESKVPGQGQMERSPAAEKTILSKVRRNYIYFSSLLQEPEAKWRRTTEARGVSITQLDSIDPTLVVYRAEATFVGVGLWDLYGAVISPGARIYWDKQHEDAVLLEDVNELTEMWHYKTKPAWPVTGRDAVVLKTVYKSPTTIHVFSFSVDSDSHLFPHIPPLDPNTIRTQVDLQGWAIESLSPTTTLLTLLEQSDPKGWTNKTSVPSQMINLLAGIGEFAIKCGGPPVVTRLGGAKMNEVRYDHEKGSFKVEYEVASSRRMGLSSSSGGGGGEEGEMDSNAPNIECEIRCDVDTWASSLDIVVDPPPQSISCLRRHRLSLDGGGLWLTLSHDSVFVEDERLLTIVRRAPGKEKGLVMVNGAKVPVDVEEMPESEVKALSKRKRVKPPRIPLDQPPVVGVVRRRKAEWSKEGQSVGDGSSASSAAAVNVELKNGGNGGNSLGDWASAPRMSSPLSRFLTYAVDQATSTTQSAVAAISPANGAQSATPSSSKMPMQYALDALAWTQDFNMSCKAQVVGGATGSTTSLNSTSTTTTTTTPAAPHQTTPDGWTFISDKGLPVHRKLIPEISPIIPVHKGSKVIEGVSAEELACVVTQFECRKHWDDRFDSAKVLESFGGEAKTVFLSSKAGFPFRDRGFYLASVMARAHVPPLFLSRRNTGVGGGGGGGSNGEGGEHSSSNGVKNAIFCVSASFGPDSVLGAGFDAGKCNPYTLPIGRVYVDAWILETLDPYTKENYAIPSTRCTRLVAMDFAGSIPAAVNSMINATLPRAVLSVEAYVKGLAAPLPLTRLPCPGMVVVQRKEGEWLSDVSWKLRRRDEIRSMVGSEFRVEERVYGVRVLVALSPSSNSSSSSGLPTTGSRMALSRGSSPRMASQHDKDDLDGEKSVKSDVTIMPGTMSPLSSPTLPPPTRQRAVSSGSGHIPSVSDSSLPSSLSYVRGRTTSSAFTNKGELKPSTDLLVAELVVDSKMYPGGYVVNVKSRTRKSMRVGKGGRFVGLLDKPATTTTLIPNSNSSATITPDATTTDKDKDKEDDDEFLPLQYTIHTMPSSPLHSSGLNTESPTRHLLRLTLPTAQYQVSTVQDPLTGQTQCAPPKPAWFLELESEGGGAIVDVEVNPKADVTGEEKEKEKGKGKKKGVVDVVLVNGKKVDVVSEKVSLTSLGREELLDDRVSKMGLLSRVTNETEPLPDELKFPIGIADDLLDSTSSLGAGSFDTHVGEQLEARENSISSAGEDSPGTPTTDSTILSSNRPHATHVASSSEPPSGGNGHGKGLFGFFQSYPNPLARFTTASVPPIESCVVVNSTDDATTATITGAITSSSSTTADTPSSPRKLPGGLGDVDGINNGAGSTTAARAVGMYPLSTVVVVALIAFLIGSLLRSLLSPADFIYVATDMTEAEEKVSGWREIRRLLELKYIIGGWDFQVAVVRRH